MVTIMRPPLQGKFSERKSITMGKQTMLVNPSTRLPLLPLVPSFSAISALFPITMYVMGRKPGPPEERRS